MKKPVSNNSSILKRFAIDTLGVLLIVAALLFGWLPGIGGIPLFLAGLGLLATNHKWARRLLKKLKSSGETIVKTIFKQHPLLMFIYDILAVILLLLAGIIFFATDGNILRGVAVSLLFFGVGLFIGNRNRLTTINTFVNKIYTKYRVKH